MRAVPRPELSAPPLMCRSRRFLSAVLQRNCTGKSLMTGELRSWSYHQAVVGGEELQLELRNVAQEYGFRTVMLLPAGSYAVCWSSPAGSSTSIDVGRLYVKGRDRSRGP